MENKAEPFVLTYGQTPRGQYFSLVMCDEYL